MSAGVNVFEVTDAFGVTETIFIDLENPSIINVFTDADNDWIDISAIGGTGEYTYSIDGGQTFSDTPLFESLENGNYDIVVMDNNGCVSDARQISVFALWNSIETFIEVSCFGFSNGRIEIIAEGRFPPFAYQLDDGDMQVSPVFENLEGASYEVIVTDNEGN